MKRAAEPTEDGKQPATALDPATEAASFLDTLRVDGVPRLCAWRGDWLLYAHGAYRPVGKYEVRSHVIRQLNQGFANVTKRVTGDVLDQVAALAMVPSWVEPHTWLRNTEWDWAAKQIIVAKNGLLNLQLLANGEECIRPLTPRFFSHWALEFPVELHAPEPSVWLNFLSTLWSDDPETIDCLQEIFGYVIAGGTWLQKIFAFIGPKRSGKGTIARVLRHLVGLKNCAGPTLSGLGTNFGLWPLLGKTLATISDARLSGRTDQAVVVERLLSISGEDALTIDRKNLEPVTCTLPTRIILISNELPRLGDSSGATASRVVLLRFSRSFYGTENPKLTDELVAELPSILLWAVAGWKRLIERGHLVQPRSGAEMVADLEELGSPVAAFVRERCILDPAFCVAVSEAFTEWKSWCEAKGQFDVGTEAMFGRNLTAAFPQLVRTQPRDDDGGRYRAYRGLGFRSFT